jgi:hypothetical protein
MGLSGAIHASMPLLIVAGALIALRRFFGGMWRELDAEALHEARVREAAGSANVRPLVAFATCAIVLTAVQYYGDFAVYRDVVRPVLEAWDMGHPGMHLGAFEELYARAYWEGVRVVGFVLVPLAVNALLPKGDAAPLGLGVRDLRRHAWIVAVFLALVLPVVWLASRDPAFERVYPSYRDAGRSGFDLLAWEILYLGHFLALEIFLRGWLLAMLRGVGSAAIFALTVPYCMMHFTGKPYAETMLSVAAGVALGSLAAKTRSVWPGFVLHAVVALMMDVLVLAHAGRLPGAFWPDH